MRKSKKGTVITFILILVFLAGLSLLLYPTVSEYWSSLHQTKAILDYMELAAGLDDDVLEALRADARAYNAALAENPTRFSMSDEEQEEYESLLAVPGTNVIGYVEIAKIDCFLPIYHGTDAAVLRSGVGHLEGSSLPVGGEGTHCVITGHRGLPSARLFTDLDQIEEGDTFVLYVLGETLVYEVDQILVVKPEEMDALAIEEGEDYCTLVTCTPYGINTHRLLVRGHRIDGADYVTADAMQVEIWVVAVAMAIPGFLLLTALAGAVRRGRRQAGRRSDR